MAHNEVSRCENHSLDLSASLRSNFHNNSISAEFTVDRYGRWVQYHMVSWSILIMKYVDRFLGNHWSIPSLIAMMWISAIILLQSFWFCSLIDWYNGFMIPIIRNIITTCCRLHLWARVVVELLWGYYESQTWLILAINWAWSYPGFHCRLRFSLYNL